MSFNDEAVKAKLSALNETQDSIVTVAQWIMFYRRYAERIAKLWLQRLTDSTPPKRLNLVYLANGLSFTSARRKIGTIGGSSNVRVEVIQQSKVRKRDDFLLAFTPIIADATLVAAKGANNDTLQKLRRVIEVWRQRAIFDQATQDAVEARLEEVDKGASRAPAKKPLLGGSLFASNDSAIPPELASLVPLQQALTKASLSTPTLTNKANAEYSALNDPSRILPPPPVHAKDLTSLIKTLANAEDAVSESLKARQALITSLEKLLETNKTELMAEENKHAEIKSKKEAALAQRREVEDQILQGISTHNGATRTSARESEDPEGPADELRPEVERFTPPPIETTTPPGNPTHEPHLDGSMDDNRLDYEAITPPPVDELTTAPYVDAPASSNDTIAPVSEDPRRRNTAMSKRAAPTDMSGSRHSPVGTNGVKRQKLSIQESAYLGFDKEEDAMEGLDAEVVGMLG